MDKKTFTRQEKIEFAQRMAKNPTPAEAVLYSALSTAHIKFKKQYLVSGYILDAFLPDFMVGIECDGGYHNTAAQKIYDHDRDLAIQKCGIKVIRFKNDEVMSNPMGIVSQFRRYAKAPKRKRSGKKVFIKQQKKKVFKFPEDIKAAAKHMISEFDTMSRMPSSMFNNVRGITGKMRDNKRRKRSA